MKTRLLLLAVVAITAVLSSNIVYASHYSGYRWFLPYTDICYDSYSLTRVNIDGSTNRYSLVASEINQARNSWNNAPSIFTINYSNSGLCHNWVTAGYNPGGAWLAITNPSYQFGYLSDTDIEINSAWPFYSNTCSQTPGSVRYVLDYVMRHEFGHVVEFVDVYVYTNPVSTMYFMYDCNRWNTIKSYDSNELSSIYG